MSYSAENPLSGLFFLCYPENCGVPSNQMPCHPRRLQHLFPAPFPCLRHTPNCCQPSHYIKMATEHFLANFMPHISYFILDLRLLRWLNPPSQSWHSTSPPPLKPISQNWLKSGSPVSAPTTYGPHQCGTYRQKMNSHFTLKP